ncbi:inorganic diphosphatase, partial [Arthrospira platensis SPKY2]
MVPGTWLPPGQGGDNDPLDVFLLGETVARETVVPVRIVGAIRLLDRNENDDKLLAVTTDGIFSDVHNLPDLDSLFPGVTDQIEGWLTHYKGVGKTELLGRADRDEAE